MMRRRLLLAALVICLAACKKEPDLPPGGDPHIPPVNSFIGVWKAGGQYWEFRRDGTGGRAATQEGPFPDDFSFLFFDGKGTEAAPPSLLILEGSPVTVKCYKFTIAGNGATLTPVATGSPITLSRVSGEPQVVSLTNDLIGEWSAQWHLPSQGEHSSALEWSIKYYADGTVKVYHHAVGHQFENAYALRGNTLVIYGAWRFSIAPVTANISSQGNGKWQVNETQSNPDPADWVYTKVNAAKWK